MKTASSSVRSLSYRSCFFAFMFLVVALGACSHGNGVPIPMGSTIPGDISRSVSATSAVDFVIYDNLRKQVVSPSSAPYIVGQHISLSAISQSGKTLTGINWSYPGSSQLVSAYPFPSPISYSSPGAVSVTLAPPAPATTSVAFFPVFPGTLQIIAQATSGPSSSAVSSTAYVQVIGPSVSATWGAENPWSVDANYAFGSTPGPTGTPIVYIHLGGKTTALADSGFDAKFTVTVPSSAPSSSPVVGNYTSVQTILECDSASDISAGSVALWGTQGSPSTSQVSLDGQIGTFPQINSSFVVNVNDSPGFTPLVEHNTDSGTAQAFDTFTTMVMFQSAINSDPAVANIWVPLSPGEAWSWMGMASHNLNDKTNTWETSGSPAVATSNQTVLTSEPTWQYVFPFYPRLPAIVVKVCQSNLIGTVSMRDLIREHS